MNIERIISQWIADNVSFVEGLLSGFAMLCKRLLDVMLSASEGSDTLGYEILR